MGTGSFPFAASPEELAAWLGGRGRADAVWRALRRGEDPVAAPGLGRESRRRLAATLARPPVLVVGRRVAACGTRKLRVELADGLAVETVLVPGRRRTTVCLSTQVGCARGCGFCVTATMGLARSLAAEEIVAQVLVAFREARAAGLPPPTNVVFMGMGEPLDNWHAVRRSLDVLTHPRALAVAPGRTTVSTVGPSPEAVRRLVDAPARIAWSVHTAREALRRRLVPGVRAPLAAVRDAFVELVARRGDPLFVEVTLLEGVNDGEDDARALAAFLAPFGSAVRVNLLGLNPGRPAFAAPDGARIEAFARSLRAAGYFCSVRRARGADEAAACGQLATRGAAAYSPRTATTDS